MCAFFNKMYIFHFNFKKCIQNPIFEPLIWSTKREYRDENIFPIVEGTSGK